MAQNPLVVLQKSLAQEVREAERGLSDLVARIAAAQVKRLPVDEMVRELATIFARVGAAGDLGARIAFRFGKPRNDPGKFVTLSLGQILGDDAASWDPFDPWRQGGEMLPEIPLQVPMVAFEEAVRWLQLREPRGAQELLAMGQSVASIYGQRTDPGTGQIVSGHGFALALATTRTIANEARNLLVEGITEGKTNDRVAEDMIERWSWPQRYADMVVRTSYNQATTAGNFQQAEQAEKDGWKIEFVFQTAGDVDVRSGRPQDHGENHAALDGYRAPAHSSVWDLWSPPLGWNCRCNLVPLVVDEYSPTLPVPPGAKKHPGFGHRADRY